MRDNKTKYQEILHALADFYCQGYVIDWRQLFGDLKPLRIHLPTYPFVKETLLGSCRGKYKGEWPIAPQVTDLAHWLGADSSLMQQNTSDLLGTAVQFNLHRW